MDPFMMTVPTIVHYGKGILEEALRSESEIITGNVLVITTGRSLYQYHYIQRLEEILKNISSVKKTAIWDHISADPELSDVRDAVDFGLDCGADIVIGFGGGSSMDAAKAVAAGIGGKQVGISLDDMYYGDIEPPASVLPVVAIPTTAGTGSELSKGAIISSRADHMKKGIRGQHIFPKLAVVDPELTYHIPHRITMETGFDVVAHATESYISKKSNDFSRMLSEKTLSVAGEMLPRLARNLDDHEARDAMSYASLMMGINVGNVGNALPHRMQYPVGAHTGTSHGAGLLALYPSWLSYEYHYEEEKVKHIVSLLTGETQNTREQVFYSFRRFTETLQCRRTLGDLGLVREDIPELISEISGNIQNDPVSIDPDNIKQIYYQSFE